MLHRAVVDSKMREIERCRLVSNQEVLMHFTSEQLSTIFDALDYACSARLDEFEQDKDRPGRESIQRAMRAAHDAKRFHEVLAYVKQQLSLRH